MIKSDDSSGDSKDRTRPVKPSRGGVGVGQQVLNSSNRAQPRVTPSVSNPNPGTHVSHQFNPIGAIGGMLSGAAHSIGNALNNSFSHLAPNVQRTTTTKKIIKPGWSETGHFKNGKPVGPWKYNQDNSGGPNSNWHENDGGVDEYGHKYNPKDVIHYRGGTWLRHDFGAEKGEGQNDWMPKTVKHPAVVKTTKNTRPGFQPTSADNPNQGGGWGNPLSNNNGANASRGGLQGRGTAGWTRTTPKLGYETSGQYGSYNPGRGVSGGGGAAIFPGEPAGDSQKYSLW